MRLGKVAGGILEFAQLPRGCQIGDMDDQRVEARPAFGRVDARYRFRIGRIGGQAVNGLGRNGDRFARKNQARGLFIRPLASRRARARTILRVQC